MTDVHELSADVLVVGGGPAATWAALRAARAGADVVLADKGYCGTSGATASAGTGVWYVPPDLEARGAAIASRAALGGYLADRRWSERVLDETYERLNELAEQTRFPLPVGPDGKQLRNGLQGPEYLRRMRIRVRRAGVRILDHSPVIELLVDAAGAVAGAAGYRRQAGQSYRVRAGAVVLATGGCAFQSKALGCDVNTGDGALFAVEAGAELSGMEFSNAYGIARELICGGFTGVGSHNAAWAISSGTWAGAGAARYALSLGAGAASRRVTGIGDVGARPEGGRTEHDARQVVAAVQREVLPYDKNYLRRGSVLTESLTTLDALWSEIRESLGGDGAERVRTRQAAAMTAHARWMYRAALARTESRGMAKRLDFPGQDPDQHHRLVTGGLDRIWVRPEQATIPAAVTS